MIYLHSTYCQSESLGHTGIRGVNRHVSSMSLTGMSTSQADSKASIRGTSYGGNCIATKDLLSPSPSPNRPKSADGSGASYGGNCIATKDLLSPSPTPNRPKSVDGAYAVRLTVR